MLSFKICHIKRMGKAAHDGANLSLHFQIHVGIIKVLRNKVRRKSTSMSYPFLVSVLS